MQRKTILIHVGLGKALSTYLQKSIFPNIKGLCYTRGNPAARPVSLLSNRLIHTNFLNIDVEAWKRDLEAFFSTVEEDKVLISEEWFMGHIEQGFKDNKVTIDGLKTFYPEAKILLILRRQDTLLESFYRQLIYYGYSFSLDSFINHKDGTFGTYRPRSTPNIDPRELNHLNLYRYYVSRFGKENVLCIPYELFREDNAAFLNDLYGFFGVEPYHPEENIPQNKALSCYSIRLARIFNRFLIRDYNSLGFLPSPENIRLKKFPWYFCAKMDKATNKFSQFIYKVLYNIAIRCSFNQVLKTLDSVIRKDKRIMRPETADKLLDLHREANAQLEQEIGYDLKRHGYY